MSTPYELGESGEKELNGRDVSTLHGLGESGENELNRIEVSTLYELEGVEKMNSTRQAIKEASNLCLTHDTKVKGTPSLLTVKCAHKLARCQGRYGRSAHGMIETCLLEQVIDMPRNKEEERSYSNTLKWSNPLPRATMDIVYDPSGIAKERYSAQDFLGQE